jgi:hypothetical protein
MQRPERVVCVAAGSCVLDCGAVCVAFSGVLEQLSVSAMMKAGLTLSADTVTDRPFMVICIIYFVRASTV